MEEEVTSIFTCHDPSRSETSSETKAVIVQDTNTMPSVLLIVFVLNVVIHTINNVGASSFNDLVSPPKICSTFIVLDLLPSCPSYLICYQLWTLFSLIPSASSPAETKRVALQKDLFKLKKELASISAQDEFARWAKVRRQHDKAQAELDKHST
jgi:hypothetical protein